MRKRLPGSARDFRVAACVVAAVVAAGLALPLAIARLTGASARRWALATEGEELQSDIDTMNLLHATAFSVTPDALSEITYAVSVFGDAATTVIGNLRDEPVDHAAVRAIDDLYQRRRKEIDADLGSIASGATTEAPTSFTALDTTHAELRQAVAEFVATLERDAERTAHRVTVLTWLGIPFLSIVMMLILLWMRRSRRAAGAVAAHEQQMAQFEAMVQSSQDVITVVGEDGCFRFVSPAAREVLGYAPEELLHTPVARLLGAIDVDLFAQADLAIRESGAPTTIELNVHGADRSTRHFEATGTDAHTDWLAGTLWTWRDVHDRKVLEYQLVHQAFHDSLTGLANRALFRDRAEQALMRAVRTDMPTAVLFFDLDGFKTINDSLGHGAGDQALVSVADRLRDCVRPGDTIARLGGDEFAVLLEAADVDQAHLIAQRVRHSVRRPIRLDLEGAPTEVALSVSIGIAMARPSKEPVEEVLRNADAAMYAAKAGGRDRVEQFAVQMIHEARQRLELHGDLQKANQQRQLRVFYQPIVNLVRGEVVALEALLRWQHPTLGLIGPSRFVPLAEESGLILDIGRWVVGEAVREATRHRQGDRRVRVNVNLSARQLMDPLIVDVVESELRRHQLDPALLALEITESVLLSGADEVTERLDELKGLGCKVSLDDFGTGYSSLSYLQRLPIDSVKIDRSFVSTTLDPGERGRVFVETIVNLSRSLSLETVAEGVESNHQLERLREIGCDNGQGFYFAPAVPADEVDAIIEGIHQRFHPAHA